MPVKTIEEHFRDWESHVIGYGYGSGEPHTIPALRQFFALCNEGAYGTSYDYRKLEAGLGQALTWVLISVLCKADIIEYGTSPRNAWLTEAGATLKQFMLSKTADELVGIACDHGEEYAHCFPDYCNCDRGDGESRCINPFW